MDILWAHTGAIGLNFLVPILQVIEWAFRHSFGGTRLKPWQAAGDKATVQLAYIGLVISV